MAPAKPWQEIQASKKEEQASRIPNEWKLSPDTISSAINTSDLRSFASSGGILTEKELKISKDDYDATDIATAIAQREYSALEVVTAFCKRAAIAQQLTNCLTEIMFEEAMERAKKLDEEFERTGKTVGPLHGVPMTFKECFHLKGYDASDGYISRAFDLSKHDSYLVEIVRNAGAVVISKTNVPQTMLVAESDNNVFGQTKNPVVSHLTCGGSSGGEGSLMAFRGSALGIGTDVGGSIRIPAAANGVYGYKPSFGVLPLLGYAASNWPGLNTGIPAVCGPLANSARDLALLTRVVRSAQPWRHDPALIPNISPPTSTPNRPVIGIIHSSGLTPHPPIRRALVSAASKLASAGYLTKPITPPNFDSVRAVTAELFTIDGLSCARQEMSKSGEPPVPSVRSIGFWDLERKTPEETWALNARKLAFQKEMLDLWRTEGVDVVMCPAGAHTAVKPGDWTNDMYTVVWNAMDYPAIIVPFSTVDPTQDPVHENFQPLSELDAQIQAMYDPNLLAGAPVGLQFVGPRLGDERLLQQVEDIDKVLNG